MWQSPLSHGACGRQRGGASWRSFTPFESDTLNLHPFHLRAPRASSERRRLLLAGAATLAGCGGGTDAPPSPEPALQVSFEGPQGLNVVRLRDSVAGTMAVTDDGLFLRTTRGWQSLGLAGRDLVDAASMRGGRIVASSRFDGLFESSDAGRSWRPLISNFGGSSGPETAWALLPDGGRLIATHGYGFAESHDGGSSWALRVGSWGQAGTGTAALTLGSGGDVWFGGQNALQQLVLGRWRSTSLAEWDRLMPSPSVVKSVRLVPVQPLRALVCAEGGIIQTRDDGRTWTPVFVNNEYRFYFDVLQDPAKPGRWVTAGYGKTDARQPLRVAVSDDDGVTWRVIQHADDGIFGGVLSMNVVLEDGRSVYRFGLARGGIARVVISG